MINYNDRVVGKVNEITFDNKNILMKSEEQIISGKKTFTTSFPLAFDELNLKRFLNGVNITLLIENQVYFRKIIVFKKLYRNYTFFFMQ